VFLLDQLLHAGEVIPAPSRMCPGLKSLAATVFRKRSPRWRKGRVNTTRVHIDLPIDGFVSRTTINALPSPCGRFWQATQRGLKFVRPQQISKLLAHLMNFNF
jgi:hypothetical protein